MLPEQYKQNRSMCVSYGICWAYQTCKMPDSDPEEQAAKELKYML